MDAQQQPIHVDQSKEDQSTVLLSLEDMIRTNISLTQVLVREMKKTKEQYEDSFTNNPTFRENAEQAKIAAKKKSESKMEISKQPAVASLRDKLKSIRLDLKEKKAALSDYLLEYKRMTGATQLELFEGETIEIIESARAVKV